MTRSWVIAIASALFGSIVSATAIGYAQPSRVPASVAYVNVNRVLAESVAGRADVARLQSLQQQKNADIRTKQQALEQTRRALAQTTEASARAQLSQQEQTERADLDRATLQAQSELQALQREVNGILQGRLKSAVGEVMKTQPYQMVVNDASVLWAAPELDLTTAVIQTANSTK